MLLTQFFKKCNFFKIVKISWVVVLPFVGNKAITIGGILPIGTY